MAVRRVVRTTTRRVPVVVKITVTTTTRRK